MLNDKQIKSCVSRFNSGAYSRLACSFCVRSGILSALIQPRNDSSSSSEDDDEDEVNQAPLSAATTSTASWWRSIVVKTAGSAGVLSLSCARLTAGRVTTLC